LIENVSEKEQLEYENILNSMTDEEKIISSSEIINKKIIISIIISDIDFRGDIYK